MYVRSDGEMVNCGKYKMVWDESQVYFWRMTGSTKVVDLEKEAGVDGVS